jgi:hypothetical protein
VSRHPSPWSGPGIRETSVCSDGVCASAWVASVVVSLAPFVHVDGPRRKVARRGRALRLGERIEKVQVDMLAGKGRCKQIRKGPTLAERGWGTRKIKRQRLGHAPRVLHTKVDVPVQYTQAENLCMIQAVRKQDQCYCRLGNEHENGDSSTNGIGQVKEN